MGRRSSWWQVKIGVTVISCTIFSVSLIFGLPGLGILDIISCYWGSFTSRAQRTMLLHNVKQHNVNVTWRNVTKRSYIQHKEFQNVKNSKHKRHIMDSATKRTPLQNVKCTLRKRYKTCVYFVTLYVMWRSRFDTFMFRMLTLCAAMLSNIHVL